MKQNLLLLVCLMVLSPWGLAAEAPAAAAKPVAFDTHDGYFVSNKFEAAAPTSFVVLKDQAAFDKVFGVGMVMGDKSHRLAQGAFDKKMVVAAIHRGKAMVTYQVQSVAAEDKTLVLRYTATSKPDANAEFSCPLIIALDKGDYTRVRFVENGKNIKRLTLDGAEAAEAKP